jgi:hypothetical protein
MLASQGSRHHDSIGNCSGALITEHFSCVLLSPANIGSPTPLLTAIDFAHQPVYLVYGQGQLLRREFFSFDICLEFGSATLDRTIEG